MTATTAPRPGLCGTCEHARSVQSSKGSVFWLCRRSESEPQRFRKYPPLPVLRCSGHQPKPTGP